MNIQKTNELKYVVQEGDIKMIVMYMLNVIIMVYNESNGYTVGPSNWGWLWDDLLVACLTPKPTFLCTLCRNVFRESIIRESLKKMVRKKEFQEK